MEPFANNAVDFNSMGGQAVTLVSQTFSSGTTFSGNMAQTINGTTGLEGLNAAVGAGNVVMQQQVSATVQIQVTEYASAGAQAGQPVAGKADEEEKENLDGSLTDVQWVAQLESKGHECLLSPKISLKTKRRTACGLEEEEDMPLGQCGINKGSLSVWHGSFLSQGVSGTSVPLSLASLCAMPETRVRWFEVVLPLWQRP